MTSIDERLDSEETGVVKVITAKKMTRNETYYQVHMINMILYSINTVLASILGSLAWT